MNDYPSNVKEKLNFIISDMANHHWLFANRPGHDFMRQNHGKLSFYDTMRLIIGMGKGNTNDEIMDYFDLDPDRIPSQSAFNQRRCKQVLMTSGYDKKRNLNNYIRWISEIKKIVKNESIEAVHFLCGYALYKFFGINLGTIPAKTIVTYHHVQFSKVRNISLKRIFAKE